jgi:cyclopropane fatty-acyl-phospholipid synthase-like methyltransferase
MLTEQQNIYRKVREAFQDRFADFHLHEQDWKRLAFAAGLATGSTALDVGTAHGVLLHMLAESSEFRTVTGLDIRRHSQAWIRNDTAYLSGSISDPNLDVVPHDTVFCMEVLEHLPEAQTNIALQNLRAMTTERLIISVPFEEPEPLWWHDKPGGHRQRFDAQKLAALFPTGLAALFPRHGMDWMFVVEDHRLHNAGFHILDRKDLVKSLHLLVK